MRKYLFFLLVPFLLFACNDSLHEDGSGSPPKAKAQIHSDQDFVHPNESNVFDLNSLPVVRLEVPREEWDELLKAYDTEPEVNHWVKGDFKFVKNGNETILPDVALRLRGNSSRNRPEGSEGEPHNPVDPVWHQASFSVNFSKYDKNQTFEGLSKLRLKYIREDPTRIREVYSFNIHKLDNQWTVPLLSFCRLYIKVVDGADEAYFGVYKLMENIDEDYISNRKQLFGDSKGFLWKGDNGADMRNPDRSLMGESTPEDPKVYDLKTNAKKLTEAQDMLIDFITNLNEKEGDDLKEWADSTMDVQLFLRTYAVNVLCGNVDDYWANSNNYSFYFNQQGQFFFIPNDYDTSLGTHWDIVADPGTQDPYDWGNPENPLVKRIISVPEFRQIYLTALHEIARGPFDVHQSIPRILDWHALIGAYLEDDTDDNTEFADKPAWWSSSQNYRLLERGPNNYFQVRANSLPLVLSAQ